ncbi:cytochrome C oxidase assembly protein, putative [Theileria equi strain WA]|uniref:Cytochrome C oxidase assembly protein, putative n=1 Tax=Theileria equi strain WA TaxID=1537102 RepID=L1LE31_THEEQ|nr:cytochrome C oxidase assembly protein, putative [Theileria equi strain WA]EKX73413.1 cytochrome C oxidase assembly protein, putative [Theileria equi strain WA]|eukprot:XP_004832865.1 cytochrome C oxidase assembly protein, putative [Theileria equi strain WA]
MAFRLLFRGYTSTGAFRPGFHHRFVERYVANGRFGSIHRGFSSHSEAQRLKLPRRGLDIAVPGRERSVGRWLLSCAGLTAGVMTIGAYVRLNESGLSMLDWKFLGLPLPSTEQEWNKHFDRYKETPEYKSVHYDITLEEYKNIFVNEWVHRMAGRISGAVFAGGFVYFTLTKALKPAGKVLAAAIGALGVSQAFIGKWMVASGFEEPTTENKTPRVSPYRLTLHFLDALGIYSLCLWNGLNLLSKPEVLEKVGNVAKVKGWMRRTAIFALFTMAYGTLVAGNDAGLACNTWPKMMNKYIPDEIANIESKRQWFENGMIVQFVHRCMSYLTFASALCALTSAKSGVPVVAKKAAMGVFHASMLQIALGIITVVNQVPLHGALSHHANALILWSILLNALRKF